MPTPPARRLAGLLTVSSVLVFTGTALAHGPSAPSAAWAISGGTERPTGAATASPPPTSAPPPAAAITAGLGYARSYGSSFSGGVGPELSLGGHASIFELGARGDYLGSFAGSRLGLGAYGGIGWYAPDFSLSLQGELGMHDYRHVGGGLLSDDPGAGATFGYVGGRTSFDLRLRRGKYVTPLFGAAISLRHDLAHQHAEYTYKETPWLDPPGSGPRGAKGNADLGAAAELGLTLRAGIEFD